MAGFASAVRASLLCVVLPAVVRGRPKVLCLHGGGQTASSFQSMLSELTSSASAYEYVFASGPYSGNLWLADPPGGKGDPTTDPDWDMDSYQLLDTILDEQGPFHGILGYSQGSAYAVAYLAHVPAGTFEFAIMFCGYLPTTHEGIIDRINSRTPLTIPALVFSGAQDDVITNSRTAAQAAAFSSPTVVTSADAGHHPPYAADSAFQQVVEFLDTHATQTSTAPTVAPPPPPSSPLADSSQSPPPPQPPPSSPRPLSPPPPLSPPLAPQPQSPPSPPRPPPALPPPADIVHMLLTVAGAVEDYAFGTSNFSAITTHVAATCNVETDYLSLVATAASVILDVSITVPTIRTAAEISTRMETTYVDAATATALLGVQVQTDPQFSTASASRSKPNRLVRDLRTAGIITGSVVCALVLVPASLTLFKNGAKASRLRRRGGSSRQYRM